MREELNGMVYDLEFLTTYWPTVVENSWLNITEEPNSFKRAYLINNTDHNNKSIIFDNNYNASPEFIIASIGWFSEVGSSISYATTLTVNSSFHSQGLGYWIGGAIKSYLAYYNQSLFLPPPIDQREPFVNEILKKWSINYQDNFTKFLAEDGNYYTYSEWLEAFN
jgi:hypothetical protein